MKFSPFTPVLLLPVFIHSDTAFAQVPNFAPQEGLVGWYSMDGNVDDSGDLGLDGSATNLLWTEDRFGNPDGALDLSQPADDYVDLPSETDALFDSTITLAMWVNYPAVPGQKIFHQGPTPGLYDNFSILIWDIASTGDMAIRLYTESSSYASYSYQQPEGWKHLAFTVDGAQYSIYVDGIEVKTGNTAIAWENSLGTVRIGESIFGNPYNYLGQIDDLALWNRALSAEEVAGIYLEQPIVPGCTDLAACNFNPEATEEDGSCLNEGCNDPAACNFNGLHVCTVDCIYPAVGEDCGGGDGLCGPGTFWNANSQLCEVSLVGDSDLDGCVTTSDLLNLLSLYGGCWDLEAQSFACGADHVSYHGHDYATVQIGENCWFAENLRTELFANGDSISVALEPSDWAYFGEASLSSVCALGYDSTEVVDERGLWYNSFAARDERNICPSGWHVSTENDWIQMELGLGAPVAAYAPDQANFPSEVAVPLMSSEQWNGTNSTGFNAVKTGFIWGPGNNGVPGHPSGTNTGTWMWSVVPGANDNDSYKWRRKIEGFISVASTSSFGNGMVVRCVRDSD